MLFFLSAGLTSKSFFLFYCRSDSTVVEGDKIHGGENSEDEKERDAKDDTQEKQGSKKKGKGKKGKKGKGRGKKSNREASEKDKTALKEFVDSLKGARRLMVRAFPFSFCNLLSAIVSLSFVCLMYSGIHITYACKTLDF